MPYYSTFWDKHYKDIGNCCMTAPLNHEPANRDTMPPERFLREKLTAFIDTEWMRDKKMKWIGQDKDGWVSWITPDGMIYRLRDLKRTDEGKEFEKESEELKIYDDGDRLHQHLSGQEFFEWELAKQRNCEFCPKEQQGRGEKDATTSTESGGGGDDENQKENNDWKEYAKGNANPAGIPDYGAGYGAGNAGGGIVKTNIPGIPIIPLVPMPTGSPGSGYTPPPTNPVVNNGTVKTNADVVTPATSPFQKIYDGKNIGANKPGGAKPGSVGAYGVTPTVNGTKPMASPVTQPSNVLDSPVGNAKPSSVVGDTTRPPGGSNPHKGTDYPVPIGTKVTATAAGKVVTAGFSSKGYGNRVIIDHGPSKNGEGNVYTIYAHGSKVLVEVGQNVKAGDEILKSGNTGKSTGPHLHYEVVVTSLTPNDAKFYTDSKIRHTPKDLRKYL